ncbi:MAG: hydrogenase maturation nickel metallochaperone HypA [Candidatus Thorarchaeota archaeon]|nr:MAG: hydrogenase maturation nickel metallochaperone HypA [Candidatus Thorarchaeota archaeon]
MHEFSAACSIVEAALEGAKGHRVKRITAVNVEVGEFTFLVPEQLEFNFEIASRDTIMEGASLNITTVQGRVKCQKCGHEGETKVDTEIAPQIAMFSPMKCSECGSSATDITGGKDFVITNIEVEIAPGQSN